MAENNHPNWDQYFLGLAHIISLRSKDPHTKHGCVITRDNKIISTGYNSYPKGMPDEILPKTRPEKYPWMIHSEANAIYNTQGSLVGSTAYVTGKCCTGCLMALHQAGTVRVVMANRKGWEKDGQESDTHTTFLAYSYMEIDTIEVDHRWMLESLAKNSDSA